jgi:hypothetical protein
MEQVSETVVNENNSLENYEVIAFDENPNYLKWLLTPLYKKTNKNKILFWQIGFDGVENLLMKHGFLDGIIRMDRRKVKKNKTSRNLQEQALLNARHKYLMKINDEYKTNINEGNDVNFLFKGMKGYTYKFGDTPITFPVYVQKKLDGIRMLVDYHNNEYRKRSYINTVWKHLNIFDEELKELFKFLPEGVTLDGEIYSHKLSFNVITSITKTIKKQHPKISELNYYFFDFFDQKNNIPYEFRFNILIKAYNSFVEEKRKTNENYYPTYLRMLNAEIANNDKEIFLYHNKFVKKGYEGIMIKRISNNSNPGSDEYSKSLYKSGKSNHIFKYKDFMDEEAVIVEVKEGEGTDQGSAVFIVKNSNDKIFSVRMAKTLKERKKYFENKKDMIGKVITVRYQEVSDKQIPRFAIGIGFRDYE